MKLPMSVYGTPGAKGDTGAGVPNGGTTGQQLAKASNTDQDTAWVDPGLPGTGTMGQVAYYGADNVLAGSNKLTWDDAGTKLTLAAGGSLFSSGDLTVESGGGDLNLNADGFINTNTTLISPGYRLNGAAAGGIIFADSSDNLVQSTSLVWDDGSKTLTLAGLGAAIGGDSVSGLSLYGDAVLKNTSLVLVDGATADAQSFALACANGSVGVNTSGDTNVSGSATALYLNGPITGPTNSILWSGGPLLPNGDNTLDLGASVDYRLRTGYFGTSVVTPLVTGATALELRSDPAFGSTIQLGADGNASLGNGNGSLTVSADSASVNSSGGGLSVSTSFVTINNLPLDAQSGVIFPPSDPMVVGAWWNNSGVLTISAA